MTFTRSILVVAALVGAAATLAVSALGADAPVSSSAGPQEAVIRKALQERLGASGLPAIDEVNKTPVAGLYEVRLGTQIFYTDAEGAYLIDGQLIELKTKRNLTEERLDKINAIDFASLPLKDAIVWKTGTGKRRMAVFADPNCGYCKRFEKELAGAKDLTVYTFLIPILGGDSPDKAKAIWCAKDSTAAWRNWMLNGVEPPKLLGDCATPIERNLAFSRKHHVNGTPSLVFEDGVRVPGMLNAAQLEKRLAQSAGKS